MPELPASRPSVRARPCLLAALTALFLLACGTQPPAGHQRRVREEARPGIVPPVSAPDTTPGVNLTVRRRTLKVELVRDPEDRALGLMFRESLAPDSGMLFVFDSLELLRFWMKNTLIPLEIAFADDAGVIVDIQRMAALDTITGHVSAAPARYAVEANLGWFTAAGARIGDTIHGIPSP